MPADRDSDAVRFAIAKDGGDRLMLHYSCERDHVPIEHGLLQYDCTAQAWRVAHPDACIQRQAECYVLIYLERRNK